MTSVLARNCVNVTGQGTQAIVFVHGFGCDQDDWRLIAPRFERDYKVVRYDITGYGGSDRAAYDREKYNSLQGHATDLLEIVHELSLPQPYLVGHSAGAMIAVLGAVREQRLFAKLALVAGSPRYIDELDYEGGAPRAQVEGVVAGLEADYASWCENVVPFAMGHANRPQLSADLVRSFKRADPEIAKHFAHAIWFSDFRSALPYLRTPTLVVQCPDDPFVPVAVGRFLSSVIPDAELALLKNPGHYPQLSGPDELASVLHRWAAS
jgi:sigma-B regulation protein RsbQ